MAIKKTLTGWDFCECPPCEERGNEIYPTTSDDQVIIDELGSNLATWLNIGMDGTYYTSLYSWLQANYPNSSYTLPVATDSTLGGVIVDTTNLTISNDGVLSVDVSSLNIPSVETATLSASGTVKLGNSTTLTSNFSDGTISGQVHDAYSYSGHVYALPLRLDAQGRAGVVVPTDLFTVNQSTAASTWTFDWSKKVTNVSIGTPTSGVETNYVLLGNKDVNTANGELGYDDDGELSTSCGYPRLALVAGDGITMTRYTNTFIPQADNYWGGNITEILITADGDGYELPAATTTDLGGIKIGYSSTDNRKAVRLDNDNKAFVELKAPTSAWVGNGLSQHYFSISDTGYVPIMKIKLHNGYTDGFKTNVRFQIISRHDGHYFGDFYLDYKHTAGYTPKIIDINIVSDNYPNTNNKCLLPTDIVVKLDTEAEQAVVYRNIRNYYNYPGHKDTFIVSIVGNNDQTNGLYLNDMVYYCTTIYEGNGTEVLVGDTSTDSDSAIRTEELSNDYTHIGMVPYTDPQVAGQVWNDNGTLKVSTGA